MPYASADEALDALTDAFTFKRVCSALLTWSYPHLKPFGGSHDSGRDAALHSNLFSDGELIWAQYSLERAWTQKVRRELRRVCVDSTLPRRMIFCFAHPAHPRRADIQRMQAEAGTLAVDVELFGRPWLLARLDGPLAEGATRLLHVRPRMSKRVIPAVAYTAWLARGIPGLQAHSFRVATSR
jgi:hypothetical protein